MRIHNPVNMVKEREHLDKIRELVLDHNYVEANKLVARYMVGTPPMVRSYQTFGNLLLDYQLKDTTAYRRSLDLSRGLSFTTFSADGIDFAQEVFASAVDDVIVTHLTSSQKGGLNLLVRLQRDKDATVKVVGNEIIMQGQVIDKDSPVAGKGGKHMRFAAKLRILHKGGKIEEKDGGIYISGAKEATLLWRGATDYNLSQLNFDRSIDPLAICEQIISQAEKLGYKKLHNRHIANHTEIFDRVSLDLGTTEQEALPTDARLKALKAGANDPGLIALYFQYGRYLLMNSSRQPAVLPANLQGIWNDMPIAPWHSNYTMNITTSGDMTLVFSSGDLSSEITPELKNACFNETVLVLDEEDADEYLSPEKQNTLVSYVVVPTDAKQGSFCYKMLFDASGSTLYYFRKHKISKKLSKGFLSEDIKRITAFRPKNKQ